MFSKILLAAAVIAPTMLAAQDEGKAKLKANDFTEVVKSAAQISGARLVGVVRFGKKASRNTALDVSAHIPKGWAGKSACLTVMSVDGFYQSHGTYVISEDWSGGVAALEYPTEDPAYVHSIAPGGIAPLLSYGSCGKSDKENALVNWGESKGQKVAILLNTSRSEETFLYLPDDPSAGDVVCQNVDFDNKTAFDTLCELPKESVSQSTMSIGVVSFKGGEMGREVEFTLHLPSNK